MTENEITLYAKYQTQRGVFHTVSKPHDREVG